MNKNAIEKNNDFMNVEFKRLRKKMPVLYEDTRDIFLNELIMFLKLNAYSSVVIL